MGTREGVNQCVNQSMGTREVLGRASPTSRRCQSPSDNNGVNQGVDQSPSDDKASYQDDGLQELQRGHRRELRGSYGFAHESLC